MDALGAFRLPPFSPDEQMQVSLKKVIRKMDRNTTQKHDSFPGAFLSRNGIPLVARIEAAGARSKHAKTDSQKCKRTEMS